MDTEISILPLLDAINAAIINPLIILMFAVATVVFVWGIVQFLARSGSDEARDIGKKHMVWGLVGMIIMVSVYGIIAFVLSTLDISTPEYISLLI